MVICFQHRAARLPTLIIARVVLDTDPTRVGPCKIGGCGPNALSVNLTGLDGNVGSNNSSLDTNRTLAATVVYGIVSKDSSIASTMSENTTAIHCNIFIENTLVIYRNTIRNDYGHHRCCSTSCRGMCVPVACCSISEVSKKALVELPTDEIMLGKRALRSAEQSKYLQAPY